MINACDFFVLYVILLEYIKIWRITKHVHKTKNLIIILGLLSKYECEFKMFGYSIVLGENIQSVFE